MIMRRTREQILNVGVQRVQRVGFRILTFQRDEQRVLHVPVLKRFLQHARLRFVAESGCAFGGEQEQLLHLPPRRVVADGHRGQDIGALGVSEA